VGEGERQVAVLQVEAVDRVVVEALVLDAEVPLALADRLGTLGEDRTERLARALHHAERVVEFVGESAGGGGDRIVGELGEDRAVELEPGVAQRLPGADEVRLVAGRGEDDGAVEQAGNQLPERHRSDRLRARRGRGVVAVGGERSGEQGCDGEQRQRRRDEAVAHRGSPPESLPGTRGL
jgi:hypothetical protein